MLGQHLSLHHHWCGHCARQLGWCGAFCLPIHELKVAARNEYRVRFDRNACMLHCTSGQVGHT